MRIPAPTCAALIACAFFGSSLAAQRVINASENDRHASNIIMFSESGVTAFIAITYSSPTWQDAYDAQLPQMRGKDHRLGKNWWTAFDTTVPLEIGGTKVPAGSYFLGLRCDKDGNFHVLAFDSKQAMKNKLMPFDTEAWQGGIAIPMKFAKDSLDETQQKMLIEIKADKDNPSEGNFAIRWGTHELSAPVKLMLSGAKDAAADKDQDK